MLGEACVPSEKASCSSFRLPDPPKEFAQQGCVGATPQRFTWSDDILETRWVCAPVTISGTKVTTGISIFEFNGSSIYLAYLASDADTDVANFLEQLARSLKVKP